MAVERQKPDRCDAVSNENTIEMTKITGMSWDCLEKFIDRLDFHEFINVAQSNKLLEGGSCVIIQTKFRL